MYATLFWSFSLNGSVSLTEKYNELSLLSRFVGSYKIKEKGENKEVMSRA